MSAAAASRFSTGLQFSRQDIQKLNAVEGQGDTSCNAVTSFTAPLPIPPPLSREEQLLRRAAALRRSINDELQPRLDAIEEELRRVHKRISSLRPRLPCTAFPAFQQHCEALRRRLHVFEEVTVQRLLKDTVEAAVAASACEAAQAARWRKSNQWPALTSFLDLQLYLCFAAADGVPHAPHSTTPHQGSSPPNGLQATAATTAAVQHHLRQAWNQWEEEQLTSTFLQRFYLLNDMLYGWTTGWRLLPLCTNSEEEHSKTKVPSADGNVNTSNLMSPCPYQQWDSLSNLERLQSFGTLCPQHLTEATVTSLEQAIFNEFADVWTRISSAV